ncbi:hypothetical protein [Sphaerisporangium album]|uniref:hypothetical protein n=1 Tax=Sphaerisporangium album TaxID=509200 RepID=UPI0015F05712|nr:hypothetical protein [Sphaerisporangium album]
MGVSAPALADSVHRVPGTRGAAEGTRGHSPTLDATPPHLVTRIVTERGAFEPFRVSEHFTAAPVPGGLSREGRPAP